MTIASLDSFSEHQLAIFQDFLEEKLQAPHQRPLSLDKPLRYVLALPGKRLRPLLTYATLHTLQADLRSGDGIALALECLHTYSLVHDDLPAMDNADLRRGQPTCHLAFNEATAILVGDALQAMAFESLSECYSEHIKLASLVQTLAQAAGPEGMVGGQMLDLHQKSMDLATLQQLHRLKTGALLTAAVKMPVLIQRQLPSNIIEALLSFSEQLGIAFQIHDDILDQESTTATLGKPQGIDTYNQKTTYVSLLGLDSAKKERDKMVSTAIQALDIFGEKAKILRQLAAFIINRSY